jgi:hypothetical protein
LRIEGGCHCGAVTYEAEIDPAQVVICHCTDCQALTGSPFRVTVIAATDQVRMTGQLPRIYVKTGDNGRPRRQSFCADCGSPLFTTGEGQDAQETGLRWGSIRQRDALVPRAQIWCRSAVPWIDRIASLPGVPTDG